MVMGMTKAKHLDVTQTRLERSRKQPAVVQTLAALKNRLNIVNLIAIVCVKPR